MDALFTYQRRVSFAETDAAGVAHFSRLFLWAEEAEHAFWQSQGFAVHPSSASKLPSPVGWPRLSAEGHFFQPLRLDAELTLKLMAEILDESTLRWQAEVETKETLAAKATITVAAVNLNAQGRWQKTCIPTEIRNCLRLAQDLGG